MNNLTELFALILSEVLIVILFAFTRKQKKGQLKSVFMFLLIEMFIWTGSLILQILFQNTNIDPFLFEKFASFGAFPISTIVLLLGLAFANKKIKLSWKTSILFVIPIISMIMAWTNDYHHLFVEKYTLLVADTVWGPYFMIHSMYSYVCIFIGMLYLISYSTKTSGFFSKQSMLLIIGVAIPLIVNVLATSSIMNLSVYITPISYSITILCFTLSIFKFKLLSISPVALQRIVDRISDAYLVLNDDNVITDFNETYLNVFKQKAEKIRNKNLFKYFEENEIDGKPYKNAFEKIEGTDQTVVFEQKVDKINRYFTVEINNIMQKKQFLGILILFKDITQHKEDMDTIHRNQDILVERERLASLGQMIGGIAHNLKTPIMSISGAAEGLTDLIKEYDSSIGDSDVTNEDHHDIAKDMTVWVEKIKEYTSYMSDVITAVKGQATTLSNEQAVNFTIEELVKRVNILMKHELKNALVNLNTNIYVSQSIELKGNVNSLVQVINNMISNAIQSYAGKPNQDIDMKIYAEDKNIVISIADHGSGLSKEVQEKLFKEMITTKGKNGTGLGLFMSYSNIRAHFNGNITFDTKEGEGTTFYITLPLE